MIWSIVMSLSAMCFGIAMFIILHSIGVIK